LVDTVGQFKKTLLKKENTMPREQAIYMGGINDEGNFYEERIPFGIWSDMDMNGWTPQSALIAWNIGEVDTEWDYNRFIAYAKKHLHYADDGRVSIEIWGNRSDERIWVVNHVDQEVRFVHKSKVDLIPTNGPVQGKFR
jgi:hypothetical protein